MAWSERNLVGSSDKQGLNDGNEAAIRRIAAILIKLRESSDPDEVAEYLELRTIAYDTIEGREMMIPILEAQLKLQEERFNKAMADWGLKGWSETDSE